VNQSFEIKELRRFCNKKDFIEYSLSVSDLNVLLDPVCDSIIDETFEFDIKQIGSYYLSDLLDNKLILRKLNDNIKRIYKNEQANRKIIISQLSVLLEETCPCWIIKTDIKSFYESIDRCKLIDKFKDDSMLSYYSMFLLKKLFSNKLLLTSSGLPRGMNISATLSEIYMRKFDKWIKKHESVFYYARFVDDIIIFSNSLQDAQLIIENLNSKLVELAPGLTINMHKTQLFDSLTLGQLDIEKGIKLHKNNFLEYLGYKFSKINNDNKLILSIGIAEKKIKKMKTRIMLSFLDYSKNKNFSLLNNRIRFLTGNYGIKKTSEGNTLKSGIYFNYPHLNDKNKLIELNTFFRRILYCKNGYLGIKMSCLSMIQRKKLTKYCFTSGFNKKIYKSFPYSKIGEIVKCWKKI